MFSGNPKFSRKDLIQRLVWALVGYLASLYGVVNLPVETATNLLAL
jgi:hypothetical protein